MKKDNYSTIIDFGSSEIRLGVFGSNLSKLFFQSKNISEKKNYDEYSKSVSFLIREAENKISNHLENATVMYDNPKMFTIDISIKKKLDKKIIFKDVCASIILEANQLIEDSYTDKKIIHSIIKKYTINDKEYLNIPDDITEFDSIILEIIFICLPKNQYKDVCEILKKNNIKILNFFSSSLVKSFKYIDFFKESKFVAFLDIGLDRTTIILFINKKLDYFNSVPVGGNHISKDISQIMELTFEESEELKKSFNKSEIDFSYNDSDSNENSNIIKNIIGKNISIDLLKKVVLTRIEEIIELSFKNINVSNNVKKQKNLNLVLIGKGSKLFNKNSFQIENKYNFKDINFYEEDDVEICESGLKFEKNFKDKDLQKVKKNQKKLGFFHRFFNFFGNR